MMKSVKKKNTVASLAPVFRLWAWILLFWSLYRYFFILPEWLDEFVIKPLVFIGPVLWYVRTQEKKQLSSIGVTAKGAFTSIYIGLGFGFIFALEGLAANAMKYGKLTIAPIDAFNEYGLGMLMLLSLATAISEEVLSRGFIFTRIYQKTKNFPYAAILSTLMFVCLHVPILVTSLKLQGFALILFFLTNLVLGFANSLLLYNTGSLVAPILVHLFWNMTVALYL